MNREKTIVLEGFHEFNESRNLVEEPILVNRKPIRLSELKHVKWKYIKLESRNKIYFIHINIKLTAAQVNRKWRENNILPFSKT